MASQVRNIPWRRKWHSTPVFLAGKSHGQRSQMGYSPWGCKESDTTEHNIVSPDSWSKKGYFRISTTPPSIKTPKDSLGLKGLAQISPFLSEWVKVTQSCLTLCDPMDYTVHGILQARILEWVAFPFSRRSSQLRDWIQVSHIAGRFFTSWATRETQEYWSG